MRRPLFSLRQRLVDGHDVDGCVFVPVNKPMFHASKHTVDLLGLVQDYALVPFLENARHKVAVLALTATLGGPELIYQRNPCPPYVLKSMTKPCLRHRSIATTGC